MPLSLSHHHQAGAVTLAASGEIDLSTVEQLEREIASTAHADATAVVVDLSGVTFIDSAGIGALLKGRRLADERGQAYRVVGAEGLVRQVLEMTGVWSHLSGHAD